MSGNELQFLAEVLGSPEAVQAIVDAAKSAAGGTPTEMALEALTPQPQPRQAQASATHLCPCGQPKLSHEKARYCETHSRLNGLIYDHLGADATKTFRQALVAGDQQTQIQVVQNLANLLGGKEALQAAMKAPRRKQAGGGNFPRRTNSTPQPAPAVTVPTASTTQQAVVEGLDQVIAALNAIRNLLSD